MDEPELETWALDRDAAWEAYATTLTIRWGELLTAEAARNDCTRRAIEAQAALNRRR